MYTHVLYLLACSEFRVSLPFLNSVSSFLAAPPTRLLIHTTSITSSLICFLTALFNNASNGPRENGLRRSVFTSSKG